MTNTCLRLDETLLSLLSSKSQEINHAAAFALGNVAIGDLSHYMPVILEAVKTGGKKLYLIFVALREIIVNGSSPTSSSYTQLTSYSKDIWNLLFLNVDTDLEQGTRNGIAECLGKLVFCQPSVFLSQLVSYLADKSSNVRMTAVSALPFSLNMPENSDKFNDLLSPIVIKFLLLISDENLNVRRNALSTFNSIAFLKPNLIRPHLVDLLPLLYQETKIRKELLRIVEMGPFKHTVDDGLQARKACFDCLLTLLDTSLSGIEIFVFLDNIIVGLSDTAFEIVTLCHLAIQRLIVKAPTAVVQRLDEMLEPLQKAILIVSKETAVKQEKERDAELVRSATKTALLLMRCNGKSDSSGVKFEDFVKNTLVNPQSSVADVVRQVTAELDRV